MNILVGEIDISGSVTSASWSGDKSTVARTVDLEVVRESISNTNTEKLLKLGACLTLKLDGGEFFTGYIFSTEKSVDSNTIKITAHDGGIYLLRNQKACKFKGKTADAITRSVCSDFGIKTGKLAKPGVLITRKFFTESLFDIIQTVYSKSAEQTGKKYFVKMIGNELSVVEKGEYVVPIKLEVSSNITNATTSESLENMVNRVSIVNNNGVEIDSIQKESWQKAYGIMQAVYQKEDGPYFAQAKSLLTDIERTVTVEVDGDIRFVTGNAVNVNEPSTGLMAKFFIDEDSHQWSETGYTCSLTLNYKNLVEKQDSGEEV